MGKGKDTLKILLITSNLILAGILYKNTKRNDTNLNKPVSSVADTSAPVSNGDSNNQNLTSEQRRKNDTLASKIRDQNQVFDQQLENNVLDKNAHAKLKFSSIAQFRADFPADFEYMIFEDMDEDVLLLEGRQNSNDAYSATLATRLVVKPEEVVGMLKSNPDLMPGLTDNLSWINDKIQPKKLERPLPSGLSNAYFWRADGNDSKTAAFVYGIRDDNKASYFFLVHGPTKYIINNEDKFEKFLSSIELTK